jgi:hypothetical protein
MIPVAALAGGDVWQPIGHQMRVDVTYNVKSQSGCGVHLIGMIPSNTGIPMSSKFRPRIINVYDKTLTQITLSFDNPIAALDLGCGTGRYFHCLKTLKH